MFYDRAVILSKRGEPMGAEAVRSTWPMPPRHIRVAIRKGRLDYRTDRDRDSYLFDLVAMLLPESMGPPMLGVCAVFTTAAVATCDGDKDRAVAALETVLRSGFTIPPDVAAKAVRAIEASFRERAADQEGEP